MAEPSAGVWTLVQFREPLNDWTGSSFSIKCLGAPGGVAVTIGGVGEEEIANAHLICAAKVMYETLETIAGFAPGNGDVCEIIAQRARAAIAKATGES